MRLRLLSLKIVLTNKTKNMKNFYIGLALTLLIILFLEIFRKVEKRLTSALILSSIAFIYLGFSSKDIRSLATTIAGAAFFFWIAYLGYTRSIIFIIVGLILHGLWDLLFPIVSNVAPLGYDIFCLTIDVLLAIYFAFRIRPGKSKGEYKQALEGR